MTAGLRKKIVFATLPLAIVWAVLTYGDKQPSTEVETGSATLQTIAPITVAPAADTRLINIEDKQAEPWGSDPFRSSSSVASTRGRSQMAWILGGIIYSNQAPVAFVNKQMVRVGDTIDQATVVSINKKSVVLEIRGRQITLEASKG